MKNVCFKQVTGVQITEALKMVVGPLDFLTDGPYWPLKIWNVVTKIIND